MIAVQMLRPPLLPDHPYEVTEIRQIKRAVQRSGYWPDADMLASGLRSSREPASCRCSRRNRQTNTGQGMHVPERGSSGFKTPSMRSFRQGRKIEDEDVYAGSCRRGSAIDGALREH
ncbi:MAG: hypothetical protein ABSB82_23315 [Terriglobia bacterium]